MDPRISQLVSQVQTLQTSLDSVSQIVAFHRHLGTDNSQTLNTDFGLTSSAVVSALGFTPANSTAVVLSFNTRVGAVTLTTSDVVSAVDTIQTYTPSSAGTATLDLSKGNIHHITMPAGNITIALSNGTVGQCFIIRILQDSGGSRTVTFFTTIRWAGGSAPTLTTTASKADTLGFEITGSNTYDGYVVGQNI